MKIKDLPKNPACGKQAIRHSLGGLAAGIPAPGDLGTAWRIGQKWGLH